MGRVFGALAVWAIAWLVIAGLIELDLDSDLFNLKNTGRGVIIIIGFMGILPPLFAIAIIFQTVKDSSAQSLFLRLASGAAYPPFALYLRAFEYDVPAREPGDDLGKIMLAVDNIWKSERSLSAFAASVLKRDCGVEQVVAITPKDQTPHLWAMHHGAGQIEPKGVSWQEAVIALAKAARVIVIAVGDSQGVRWEFEHLKAFGLLRRTVLIFPPALPGLSDDKRMHALMWVRTFGAMTPPDPNHGFALTFDDDGEVHGGWRLEISLSAERQNRSELASALVYAANREASHVGETPVFVPALVEELDDATPDDPPDPALIEALGKTAPNTVFNILAVADYGSALEGKGEYAAAVEQHRKALRLSRQHLGEESEYTLQIMAKLARSLAQNDELEESRELLSQAYEARLRMLGELAPETLRSLQHLIAPTLFLGHLEEAKRLAASAM